jgi:hypothetical protein
MSKELESLHPKFIFQIVKKLDEKDIFNYVLYENIEDIISEAETISNIFGVSKPDHLSCEFLFEFEKNNRSILRKLYNPNISKEEKVKLIDSLSIPKQKKFTFDYTIGGSGYIDYFYTDTIEGYSDTYVRDQVDYLYSSGYYDYWEGELVNTEIVDFDSNDFSVTDVSEVKNLTESANNENTLDSLSKSDLIKLKKIIDEKLRRF